MGSMKLRVKAVVLAVALASAGASGPSGLAQASQARPQSTAATLGAIKHVVWIWEENHSYSSVVNSASAPYINALAASYGLVTNAWAISHPSAPNYLGATNGLALSSLPKTDCTGCKQPGPDIFTEGESWRSYQESMQTPCQQTASTNGLYVPRHNPATYYTDISTAQCRANDFPYPALAQDLARHTLPTFAMITPNLTDDMHTGTVTQGDNWLASNLPGLLKSTEFTSGTMVIFIIWDEGEGGGSLWGTNCLTSTSPSCHVPLLVLSHYAHAASIATKVSHYSVLRATEDLLNLRELGQAAVSPSLLPGFGL
jgi:phospholipase C